MFFSIGQAKMRTRIEICETLRDTNSNNISIMDPLVMIEFLLEKFSIVQHRRENISSIFRTAFFSFF